MGLAFGNVQHPPFVDRLIPDAQTAAWDDLGPRRPVGVCQHSMVGSLWGTDGWFRRGRASTGLTDYGVGGATDGPQWDGVILRWNDPRGRAATVYVAGDGGYSPAAKPGYAAMAVGANRAGWANGGSDGLEGDGPLFVRTLGIAAINRDLVSIERSDGGETTTPMSPKQLESICALTAYWFDQARVPWTAFPLNPAHGIVTHLLHWEFATKSCPHDPVTSRIDEIQERVRAILKAAQGAYGVPVPPEPPHGQWPAGWTEAELRARFGKLPRTDPDGQVTRHGFDPRGDLSNMWAERGAREGRRIDQLPVPRRWVQLAVEEHARPEVVLFDGVGARDWLAYRPDRNVPWRWIA